MFWLLAALAILAVLVGLFFLIRAIVNDKGDDRNLRYYYVPEKPTSTGINPIYVSPVPYSRLDVPTTSGYMVSPQTADTYTYVTTPAASSPRYTTQPSTSYQYDQPDSNSYGTGPTNQPPVTWTSDSSQIYVNPYDVYRNYHE